MATIWRTASVGIFLITLGIAYVATLPPIQIIQLGDILPSTILVFGVWLIIMALLKKSPSPYEYPPLTVAGWGIILIGGGALWLGASYAPGLNPYIFAGIIILVGIIALVYSLLRRPRPQEK